MPLGLIDEFQLLIHPLALGGGQPLFEAYADLKLIDSVTSSTGVILASYRNLRAA